MGFDRDNDDVINWKLFPRNWPFVRGIDRSPVNSPHKGQWRGALMFSLICSWINVWVNNHEAGDLRCYRAHYDVIVMIIQDPGLRNIRCVSYHQAHCIVTIQTTFQLQTTLLIHAIHLINCQTPYRSRSGLVAQLASAPRITILGFYAIFLKGLQHFRNIVATYNCNNISFRTWSRSA